ncbi:hypothetical protein [Blastochloris viridis]|uniref:Uncharacterized protein n=1 Tax=Blastochloris viridis TaxID=1079 RepID=A0A0H5BCM7_BLAVI|nr:hypothetical protein [Blastochloris viridis]ALK10105.1 hypothetical protein BVIR_2338 [Blastochloris viridis]BAR99967.1 hypothetical protein BV133_2374 [Blastochloris viridis]CUU42769.1 hypothetical protein BVIRIDIS_17840 [Blastochloris viridis]
MAQPRNAIDKLRSYLENLTPEARALVVEKLEREAAAGDDTATIVLQELRGTAASPAEAPQPRITSPQQLFFLPVEPFLADEVSPTKIRGVIPRACLEPIWTWLSRDVLPADIKAFTVAVATTLQPGDEASALRIAKSFQDHTIIRIRAALTAAARDEVAARKLSAQLGSQREVEELRDVLAILCARDALGAIGGRLPTSIKNLSDQNLDAARAVFNGSMARHPDVLPYALALLMRRLAQPWQIVRVAIKAAETDVAAKIAETPFAAAVELAFADLDRKVALLKALMKRRDFSALAPVVKDIHDDARGFRTELDLRGDSAWSRRLAAIRKDIAALLSTEIAACSTDIRRLLKMRTRKEAASEPAVSAADVATAEEAIDLLLLCRTYAGEIALNEATQRATSELNALLDTGTATLIDGLRVASDVEKPFRRSQLDAAIQLSGRVFGPGYAQTLTRAVDLAAQGRQAEPAGERR